MEYVNERTRQDDVVVVAGADSVTIDGTRSARVAHTVVRFPRFKVGGFEPAVKHTVRLDFGAEAAEVPGTGPARSSPYTMYVRQFDERNAPVSSERDRVRFMAGPNARRVSLPFQLEPHTDTVELALYQARDQRERVRLFRRRVILGRTAYRQDGDTLVPDATVTDPGVWQQNGRRVEFTSYWGRYWAEMPPGWALERVHPNCLMAAEYLLTHNVNRHFLTVEEGARRFYDPPFGPPRRRRDGILLSFSAGQDSTAAASVLPDDATKVYCRRAYDGYFAANGAYVTLRKFDAEARALKFFSPLVIVPNNFELIGVAAGLRFGFRDHFGYGAVCLLLADHFDAGYIASGAPLEHVFLGSGNRYVDILGNPSSQHHALSRFFRHCGVELTLPVGFLSEVTTNAIVNASPYRGVAVSCPNVDADGTWCGACVKCYRKLRLDGRPAPPPTERLRATLAARPLKNATSVVFAAQRANEELPELAEYMDVDLDFLTRYHTTGFRGLLDTRMQAEVGKRLRDFGVGPMTASDEEKLRRLGAIFTPTTFDPRVAGIVDDAGGVRPI